MLPGMVLPCAEEIVKQSALRRFALQKLWVHTNSPPPIDIAQRDMLAVPAHALKEHTIMHTLLALGHAGDVPSAGPVQSPLSQRGRAVQREIVLRPLAAQQLLLCPRNDSFAREVAEAQVPLLRPPPPREGLSRERERLGQGRQAAEPREEPRATPPVSYTHLTLPTILRV